MKIEQNPSPIVEPTVVPEGATQDFFDEFYRDSFAEAEALLKSFVEELEEARNAPQDKDVQLGCPACGRKIHNSLS